MPPRDTEKQRCYDAETAWRRQLHEARYVSLHPVRELLREHLSPAAMLQLDVQERRQRTRRDTGEVEEPAPLHYVLKVGLPCLPSVVLHEAAHVLHAQARGWDTDTNHGRLFRRTYLWLVLRHYGPREHGRLIFHYHEKGLDT